VTVVVHRVSGVGYRVNPVYVIDVSVAVVINAVTDDLRWIPPDISRQVGVVKIDACINDHHNLGVDAHSGVPRGGKLHELRCVLLWIVGVVRSEIGGYCPVR
jgi:hypothetical protein